MHVITAGMPYGNSCFILFDCILVIGISEEVFKLSGFGLESVLQKRIKRIGKSEARDRLNCKYFNFKRLNLVS